MGRIDGLLSVGLGQLLSSDNANSFFHGRDRVIKSLAVVLSSTGTAPGSQWDRDLSTATKFLEEKLDRFYGELSNMADWRRETLADLDAKFDKLFAAYSDLSAICDRVGALLGMTAEGWKSAERPALIRVYQQQFREMLTGTASMAV